VLYNREGDLLFTTAKDTHPTLWYSDTGERIGTYEGHTGAVMSCDVTYDSSVFVTGSADGTCRFWDVPSGRELATLNSPSNAPVRSVNLALGGKLLVCVTDSFLTLPSAIHIFRLPDQWDDPSIRETVRTQTPLSTVTGHMGKINQALWGPLNQNIYSCSDDYTMSVWDAETGRQVNHVAHHRNKLNSISFSRDQTHLVTASSDLSAKLYDTKSLSLLKTYETEMPVNTAAISPLMDHVILGGGQEASQVTTTAGKMGRFEVRFFHKIYAYEIGQVKGHFGPVNSLAFSPDGRSFVSGGEESIVRIHHFDPDYYALNE
jgi:translation initiation factor 3 subunit I